MERGSSIYEQGCNIKSATAFAVFAVASAPPMKGGGQGGGACK